MRPAVLAAVVALAALATVGCEQKPYRVFAVEVDSQPIAQAGPQTTPLAAALEPVGMKARHPQLDLNRAPARELMRLPGIDPVLVAAIVAGRPYKDKRELVRRKLLTAAQYDRWKDYLVVHKPARPSTG